MLKSIVDSLDEVPEQFHELYTQKGDKWEITGIQGLKTQADVDRLQTALQKERADHKAVRERYAPIADREVDDIVGMLDRIPELEAAAKGKLDDAQLNEIVETRIKTRLAPVEREKNNLAAKVGELEGVLTKHQQRERARTVHDAVRAAAASVKLLPDAMDDALLLAERVFEVDESGAVLARDGVGCTPGIDPAVWFSEIQSKRPHWWGPSAGGGSRGNTGGTGGGSNPWSAENWNVTQQGVIFRENPARAEQLAKSAGTTLTGGRPAPRK